MGLLISNDANSYVDYFKEMAALLGIRAYFSYPIPIDIGLHAQQMTQTYSTPVPIDIIFDENPKIHTLKAIKWVSEKPDDKPIIARLPYDLEHIGVDCLVTIPPPTKMGEGRKFQITGLYSINQYPDCWVCTLAPVFNTEVPRTDYSESSSNYVKEDNLLI